MRLHSWCRMIVFRSFRWPRTVIGSRWWWFRKSEFEPETRTDADLTVHTESTTEEFDDLDTKSKTESGSFSSLTSSDLRLDVLKLQEESISICIQIRTSCLTHRTKQAVILYINIANSHTSIMTLHPNDCLVNVRAGWVSM